VQTACPACGQRIVIDDAKVPERPFSVRCPKCQQAVRLPGRGAAPEAAPAPSDSGSYTPVSGVPSLADPPRPAPAAATPAASASNEELRVQMMAQLRREMSTGESPSGGYALVAFPDKAHAAAITLTLTRLGFSVDTVEDLEEGLRLLEQGHYSVVATARLASPQGRPETLYQRVTRLPSEARRRIFLILVGDQLKTGDGTQAFLMLADLILSTRDAGNADPVVRSTLAERKRIYQTFEDARRRFEESAV
jgi:predicted Zn finger-like uncharacterized protein